VAGLLAHIPLNYADVIQADKLDIWSLNVKFDNTSPEFIRPAHERGYKFLVYTVNELEDRELLRSMGVDGVFTNFPKMFLSDLTHHSSYVFPCSTRGKGALARKGV